jgi:hypothetical protein
MPAKAEITAPLPGLSPVAEKAIIAGFDSEGFSAHGGLLPLREIEQANHLPPTLLLGRRGQAPHVYMKHSANMGMRSRQSKTAEAGGVAHRPGVP